MKLLIANCKMNLVDYQNWLSSFDANFNKSHINNSLKIVICPNFLQLAYMTQKSSLSNRIIIGAQNVSENPPGAYTGEISVEHLSEIEHFYCLLDL